MKLQDITRNPKYIYYLIHRLKLTTANVLLIYITTVPYPTEKKKKKKKTWGKRARSSLQWCNLCPTDRWQHHI